MSQFTVYGHDIDFVVPRNLSIEGYVICHYNNDEYSIGDLVPGQSAFRVDVFRVNPGETYELTIKDNQGIAIAAAWYLYYEGSADKYKASRYKGKAVDLGSNRLDRYNGTWHVTCPANCYALAITAYNNPKGTLCVVRCGQVRELDEVVERVTVKKLDYEGIMMGESAVTLSVSSPKPIGWRVGDWLDYRDERFVLGVLPKAKRNARDLTYGEALLYDNVRLRSMAVQRMSDCMMLDYVADDNEIHYTSLPTFEFFCADYYPTIRGAEAFDWSDGVQQLADRVLANLLRRYGSGSWDVVITPGTYINKAQSVSVSSQNVWDVLCSACEAMGINFSVAMGPDEIGHIVFNGSITTEVGTEFKYGKGNGLHTLERASDESQQIVTRVMAYGNTRNMPYRHYNYLWRNGDNYVYYKPTEAEESAGITSKYIDGATYTRVAGASMYLPNLMLPMFRQNGSQAYVDSYDILRIGVREGVVFFNGENDLPDIYPSIEGVTTLDIWNAMTAAERVANNWSKNTAPSGSASEYVDEIRGAEQVTFSGVIPEEEQDAPTFTVTIRNLGFNPNDTIISGETPMLAMNSGSCAGREFEIRTIEKMRNSSGDYYYRLTCYVAEDESINQYFPNVNFQIVRGNKFVLTGIRMPDMYVRTAEQRLQAAAEAWLTDNDHTSWVYTPEIDNIFMARNPAVANQMKPGKLMHITDESLGIDEKIAISHLKISEGKAAIAEWSITLSDTIAASLAQRTTKEVAQQLQRVAGYGGGIDATQAAKIQQMLLALPDKYVSKTGADTAQGPLNIVQNVTSPRYYTSKYSNGLGAYLQDTGLTVRDLYGGNEGSVKNIYTDFAKVSHTYQDQHSPTEGKAGVVNLEIGSEEIAVPSGGGTIYVCYHISTFANVSRISTIELVAVKADGTETVLNEGESLSTDINDRTRTFSFQLDPAEEYYIFKLRVGVYVTATSAGNALTDVTLELYGGGNRSGGALVEQLVDAGESVESRASLLTPLALEITRAVSGTTYENYSSADGVIVNDGTNGMRLRADGLYTLDDGVWTKIETSTQQRSIVPISATQIETIWTAVGDALSAENGGELQHED